jgi:hypothetical protein
MNHLTLQPLAAILALLSPHVIAGICTPRTKAKTLGHFYQWFFYTHQKGAGNFSVIYSLWWSVLSSPLNGWPGLAGSANLIHSTAKCFAHVGGGYSSLQGLRHVTK